MALRCCVSLSEYNKFVYTNENLAQKKGGLAGRRKHWVKMWHDWNMDSAK